MIIFFISALTFLSLFFYLNTNTLKKYNKTIIWLESNIKYIYVLFFLLSTLHAQEIFARYDQELAKKYCLIIVILSILIKVVSPSKDRINKLLNEERYASVIGSKINPILLNTLSLSHFLYFLYFTIYSII